jgi:hypothetical protein
MEKYYVNWSVHSGNWLVKKQSENPEEAGKIVQIFSSKEKAEKYCAELNEKEDGQPTKGERFYSNSN